MKTILCFGDSNTYGYVPRTGERFERQIRWTNRLNSLLGSDYDVISEGMNGRTTAFSSGIDSYCCGLDYIVPCLISHSPMDLLIIMLGTNDTKDRFNVNAQEIGIGLEKLLQAAISYFHFSARQSQILLVAPVPLGDISESCYFSKSSREKSLLLKNVYSELAERYGCHFFDAGSVVHSLGCDGIHFTPDAHRELADGLFPVVKEILC